MDEGQVADGSAVDPGVASDGVMVCYRETIHAIASRAFDKGHCLQCPVRGVAVRVQIKNHEFLANVPARWPIIAADGGYAAVVNM